MATTNWNWDLWKYATMHVTTRLVLCCIIVTVMYLSHNINSIFTFMIQYKGRGVCYSCAEHWQWVAPLITVWQWYRLINEERPSDQNILLGITFVVSLWWDIAGFLSMWLSWYVRGQGSSKDSIVIMDTRLWDGHTRNCGLINGRDKRCFFSAQSPTGTVCTKSKAARVWSWSLINI